MRPQTEDVHTKQIQTTLFVSRAVRAPRSLKCKMQDSQCISEVKRQLSVLALHDYRGYNRYYT